MEKQILIFTGKLVISATHARQCDIFRHLSHIALARDPKRTVFCRGDNMMRPAIQRPNHARRIDPF